MPNPLARRRLGGSNYPMVAGQFVAANSQFGTIASNSSFQFTNASFTLAAWVYLDSKGSNRPIITKGTVGGLTQEYTLYYGTAADRFGFAVSNGSQILSINANTLGAPALSTWYYVVAGYDLPNTRVFISGNAGTQGTTTSATGSVSAANAFRVGGEVGASRWDGRIDCPALWSRALTTTEITTLFRGGVGMAKQDLPSGLLTNLVSYYNMDGDLNDAFGTNHLTNTGGVTFTAGKR